MQHEILCRPSYSLLQVTLEPTESVVADSGAMAFMDANVRVATSTRGGVLKGLKRKVLAGESFFQNTYTAEGGRGVVGLASGTAGDIVALSLGAEAGSELFLEKGAYLASEEGVQCDAKWGGLRGLFNEGLFVLRCVGDGLLFFHAYGEIQEIDVDDSYLVDNGYAVAWEPALEYRLTRARRIRSFLFGDQVLLRFSGRGKLWVQSRKRQGFADWIHPFRPVRTRSDE